MGQTHPQKNLPNIKVRGSIAMENIIPGMITLSLIEVNIAMSGSILKSEAVRPVDQRI